MQKLKDCIKPSGKGGADLYFFKEAENQLKSINVDTYKNFD